MAIPAVPSAVWGGRDPGSLPHRAPPPLQPGRAGRAGRSGDACGQTTTPSSRLAGDGEVVSEARTTFPSGSSRGCTCSVRLPATPGSSRRGARCRAGALGAALGAAAGAAPGGPRRGSRCGFPFGPRCSSRCGSPRLPVPIPAAPGAAPGAGPWCGSRQLPGQLPAAAGADPGAADSRGAHGRAPGLSPAHPGLTTGPGPRFPRGTHPRPRHMPRGRAWTQAEVSSLLALVGSSGEAALLMASTSRPNEALWQEISQGLAAAGYGRSVAQCRSKWKALKQAFHSERETRRRAGHHSPCLPPHYRAMKSIWKAAGRPIFGERRMPDLVKLPPRKRRSALAAHPSSSPEPPEDDVGRDTPRMLMSPLLQCVKDEPESRKYRSAPLHRAAQPRLQPKPMPGFGTEVMQGMSLGLICVGAPASIPHWVITFCLPKFPLQFQVDVGFSFTSSPNLLCSVAARCYAAAAFQPRGGCIAVVASGDHVAGVPPASPTMTHTGRCFPPLPLLGCHTALKQERAERKADFPGETSPGMRRGNQVLPVATAAPGSPGTAAVSEQPAAEGASDTSLQGSSVAGLLQSVQQLLVQILQTSRQQQALLESLASDTVSHLHLLSHSLVQVGETLHQLLLRPQTHPAPLSHYVPHVPLFEGDPGVPCSPNTPHSSPDHKEEPRVSPAAGCTPP
ncbi:LOW QUALITY PROTEIN: uncharacterized protein ACIBXB_006947 [Morphnus guianensis]